MICRLSDLMLSLSSRNSSPHFHLIAQNECSSNQTNHVLCRKEKQQKTGRWSRRFVPTFIKISTFFLWILYLNIFLSDMWIAGRKIKSWRKKWKLFLPSISSFPLFTEIENWLGVEMQSVYMHVCMLLSLSCQCK